MHNDTPPVLASRSFMAASNVTSNRVRDIIETGELTELATNPSFSTKDFKAVPVKYRKLIPDYIKDYVSMNQFVA